MRIQRLRLPSKSTPVLRFSKSHIPYLRLSQPRPSHVQLRCSSSSNRRPVPDFAFAFDIDGVLIRSSAPIPGASNTLKQLQSNNIPFILLTNGGGKHESERVKDLSSKLSINLDTSMIVQSHTPYTELVYGEKSLKDKCVLVVGGHGSRCREIAETYGFTNVVTPGDIYAAHPEVWPLGTTFKDYYASFAKPLPRPINAESPKDSLKIDAVFVYADPRDWALDIQLLLDILLSREGILGTYSSKNGDKSLPNNGYLQDGQPPLYFSNPDLLYAAAYHLPRLGQGGFRESLEGVWAAITGGGPAVGSHLHKNIIGKPHKKTYEFAEKHLIKHRESLLNRNKSETNPINLNRVYMIGDNPESDIRGANTFQSPQGIEWISLLTRTGVYRDRPGSNSAADSLEWKPRQIVDDVSAAVQYALRDSKWS